MIFIQISGGTTIAVIEPGNIDRLRSGKPMITPDRKFLLMYTPDMRFIEQQLQDWILANGDLSIETFTKIMELGKERKPVMR